MYGLRRYLSISTDSRLPLRRLTVDACGAGRRRQRAVRSHVADLLAAEALPLLERHERATERAALTIELRMAGGMCQMRVRSDRRLRRASTCF